MRRSGNARTEVHTKGAILSECGAYRYHLSRAWGRTTSTCLFVMLNPSTADADVDDPTIRKCIGFASRWGFDRLEVVNLFAHRATDPRDLRAVSDPVGPKNDRTITLAALDAAQIICAWGAHKLIQPGRPATVLDILRGIVGGTRAMCLGRSKEGAPRHPLMLAYQTPLEPYWPPLPPPGSWAEYEQRPGVKQ